MNLEYPGLRLCFLDPPVFVVEDFLTADECDDLVALADDPEQVFFSSSCVFLARGAQVFAQAERRQENLRGQSAW